MYFIYLIILMISIVEACAQFCLKKGSISQNKFLCWVGVLSYGFIAYLLLKAYRLNEGVGYSNLVWSAISIIFACVSGKIFFGEKINYLAVFLALGSVYVINQSK